MINRQLPVALLLLFTIINVGCSTDDIYEGAPTTASSQQQNAIGFGTYLKRATQTRGTILKEQSDVALNSGIGVFAMNTNDGKYDPTSLNAKDTKDYSANLMNNIRLYSSLTEDELKSEDADVADSWTYNPVRYWPNGDNDYVSFLAYAPYDESYSTLYNKDGTVNGDRPCIKHVMKKDPRDHVDLLYNSGTNVTNMQLLSKDNEWQTKGDFTEPTDGSVPSVKLNFKHATSRIGFVVTSSALKDPDNWFYYDKNGNIVARGYFDNQGYFDIVTDADAAVTIDVNKVIFLGDNHSAEDTPKGTFYAEGMLDLSNTNPSEPWNIPDKDNKIAFVYDNTGKKDNDEDSIRTIPGDYEEGEFVAYDTYPDGTKSNYIWVPNDIGYNEEAIEEWAEEFKNQLIAWGYPEWFAEAYVDYYAQYYKSLGVGSGKTISADMSADDGTITVYSVGSRGNDYMFVIPEDFSEGSGNDLWVYLDYTVNYNGAVSGEAAEGIRYKVYKKVETKFEPGKAYTLILDIGEGTNFNAVKFSVKTANWQNEGHITVGY